MSLRRGIEPIIATVILVAVALIIAVAVVGYLMGLFGGLTGGNPQITITNIALVLKSGGQGGQLEMYISNTGAGSDRLLKVEVIANGSVIASTTPSSGSNAVTTINGNFKGWVTVGLTGNFGNVSPGDTVIVKLYFEKSGTQTINVVVSA
jgi:flagellin-like protein